MIQADNATQSILGRYTLVTSYLDLVKVMRSIQSATTVAYDYESRPCTETIHHEKSGLRPEQGTVMCGLALAWRVGQGAASETLHSAYIPVRHSNLFSQVNQLDASLVAGEFSRVRRRSRKVPFRNGVTESTVEMTPVGEDGTSDCLIQEWVAHNMSFDKALELRERINWAEWCQNHDTKILARVLGIGVGPKELIGLKPLRDAYLPEMNLADSKSVLDNWLVSHGLTPSLDIWRAPAEIAGPYAAADAVATLCLWERFSQRLRRPLWIDVDPATPWWWQRGKCDIRGGSDVTDLYLLECAASLNGILSTQRGSVYDFGKAIQRASGANQLRDMVSHWIQQRVKADHQITEFNAGSGDQVRRLLHGDPSTGFVGLGITVDLEHLTDKFGELPQAVQVKLLSNKTELIQYASVDADALASHAKTNPEHADLLSMLGVVRKCGTVLTTAESTRNKWVGVARLPQWWSEGAQSAPSWVSDSPLTSRVYHQLDTTGARSGRMTSVDPNGQNQVADDKLILQTVACRVSKCGWHGAAKEAKGSLCPKCGADGVENRVLHLLRQSHSAMQVDQLIQSLEMDQNRIIFGTRCLFGFAAGHVGRTIDLSQIEVRRFAGLTGNQFLKQGYGAAPTTQQIQHELRAIRRIGYSMSRLQNHIETTTLDPYRHWTTRSLDAHSLMASLTATTAQLNQIGVSQDTFNEVMQLIASAEDMAIALLATQYSGDSKRATESVKLMKKMRKDVKSVTFGVMYGMGLASLARSLNRSVEAAKAFLVGSYYPALPEVETLGKKISAKIAERRNQAGQGFMYHDYGRRFYFDLIYSCGNWDNRCDAHGMSILKADPCRRCRVDVKGSHVVANRWIQGAAAGDFKVGYVRLMDLLRLPSFGGSGLDPVTNVPYQEGVVERLIHDENVLTIPSQIDTPCFDWAARSCMTLIDGIGIPLATSSERCQPTWADKVDVRYERFD